MIVKLFKSGKSFKSLGAYLLHDAGKAVTSERLSWTHTLNLAHDEPGLAIDEMLWTARGAENLKRAAGVRAGGRPLDHPVKHFSLSWHPSETPSREHMIETVRGFLAHMGWLDHQALLHCHHDKPHPHVHVMLNAVHPETGRALDASFEKRNAQEWAAAYEREHQLIFCEERLKPAKERTPSPTRARWEKLRNSELRHDKAEIERLAADFRTNETDSPDRDWRILKAHQRLEREAFFMDGKQAFRAVRDSVFREVRAEFRERWRDYYAAVKDGGDPERLSGMKAAILEDQNVMLDLRRHGACAALREQRDGEYATLLTDQREQRQELRDFQEGRAERPVFLDRLYMGEDAAARDRSSARDAQAPRAVEPQHEHIAPVLADGGTPQGGPKVRGGLDILGGLGLGALGAIAEIGEKLFDGFLGGGEQPPPPKSRPSEPAEERDHVAATGTAAKQAEEVARASEADALVAYWHRRTERQRPRD